MVSRAQKAFPACVRSIKRGDMFGSYDGKFGCLEVGTRVPREYKNSK